MSFVPGSTLEDQQRTLDREKRLSFLFALVASSANGFVYGYSIFSSRLALATGLTRSDVVLLGVLSQAGLGVFQYPTSVALIRAQKRGVSPERLDRILTIWCGFLACVATCGIGTVLYLGETGTGLSPGTAMGVMAVCFLLWGQAAGASINSLSTIINFNNAGNNATRRAQLVAVSCMVGVGGVFIVILYQFGLKTTISLHAFLFGLAFFYFLLTLARLRFVKRVRQKIVQSTSSTTPQEAAIITGANRESETDEESSPQSSSDQHQQQPPPAPAVVATPQPLSALLKSDVVWLTCLGTFIGIGASGTFMSSLGNLGPQLEPGTDYTFSLTITFLALQTFGRIVNAVVYGYGDWPFVFAFYQLFCCFGVSAFLMSPTPTGAFVSAALVGMSFGGFHSSFTILTATTWPGSAVDYPQNYGIALAMSSLGCVVVGQLTTVVYNAASIQDLRMTGFVGTFLFFVALLIVSFVSSLVLGKRIIHNRKKAATMTMADADTHEHDNPGTPAADEILMSPMMSGATASVSPRISPRLDKTMYQIRESASQELALV